MVAHLGLTSAWWQVLAALRYSPVPLTVAAIARAMGLTRQAVQRIVDLLAQQGWWRFGPTPASPRQARSADHGRDRRGGGVPSKRPRRSTRRSSDRIGAARIRDAIATLQAMVAIISERLGEPDASPLPGQGACP